MNTKRLQVSIPADLHRQVMQAYVDGTPKGVYVTEALKLYGAYLKKQGNKKV